MEIRFNTQSPSTSKLGNILRDEIQKWQPTVNNILVSMTKELEFRNSYHSELNRHNK